MMEWDQTLCPICKKPAVGEERPPATLGVKGSNAINRASADRKDVIQTRPGQQVHEGCRKKYCNPQQITKALREKEEGPSTQCIPVLRSTEREFNYQTDCLFCGKEVKLGGKRKSTDLRSFPVRTVEFKDKILESCDERKDAWAETVKARVLHVHDLHAADAMYHQVCSVNFRTRKQIPTVHQTDKIKPKKQKLGRPKDETRGDAFLRVAHFLEENDDEQITINDLVSLMKEHLQESGLQAYSYKHMKMKLDEHFGDKILQTEVNGKPNVVTFRSTAKVVLQDFYGQAQATDPEKEKMRIIKTAAKLIRDDIKSVKTSHEMYPDMLSKEENLNFLPESLRLLLGGLFVGKNMSMKMASIGQAVMQAARPQVLLAPLQIGLGIQMHHHFASRFLIDSLHNLGFICSYQEVQRFERNAVMSQGTDIPGFSSEFVQYAADNVDHNIRTLDGNNTFHGMGMIAAITPASKTSRPILRAQVTSSDISTVGRIPIHYHKEESCGKTTLTYQKLVNIKANDPTADLDLLWKTSIMFASSRPAWSGLMQLLHHGDHPGKSSVMFLPMIDMNPSDVTCIYSTLKFVCEHARRHGVTPIITFDQPLWWKALMIIESEPTGSVLNDIVLRLGGFHTEMSFLGSIGHLMAGSGLQEVLELIYADNAVVHMMTGKAIARAVRGHLLIDAALNALIMSDVLGMPLPQPSAEPHEVEETNEATVPLDDEPTADGTGNTDLDELAALYKNLMEGSMSAEEFCQADVLTRIKELLGAKTKSLKSFRTATLWLQYMEMVDILRKFIRAERIGNWALHIEAVSEMLPYLAASGHNLYTKSAHLYVQRMTKLKDEHPDVYRRFEEGLHVVRRSNRLWAGLSVDLTIEQVLMRSMKTSGGLTRGRGMTEQQRLIWLLSMPACADVNNAMQQLTGVNYNTGEQNKDMTNARQARDMKDTHAVISYLQERTPFSSDLSLRSISTGVHATSTVNVDSAKTIGTAILTNMDGQTAADYTFKRKDQAITLAVKSAVKIDGEAVQVDPQLLFQRLTIAAKATEDLESVFKYELCSYPPALFDSTLLLRQPQKPVLADAIWTLLTHDAPGITGQVHYVLDGGALVQRIPWARGTTYKCICTQYTEYVTKKYGLATVVFDGYDGTSTKDTTHQRRSRGNAGATVTFDEDMQVTMKKEQFLANKTNKQRFINMLSTKLRAQNCQTYHAAGDADLLIVQKAVESAATTDTVLIGDDTDLLILLIYHTNLKSCDLFFKPEPKKNVKKPRVWNMKYVKQQLGTDVSQHIFFIHTLLGCDTTSRLYGIGKGASLNKFKTSAHFREQANVFDRQAASTDDIVQAGEKALVCLYNGKPGESLNVVRHKRFCQKVASSTSHVQPQSLPPTSAAAKHHSLRVYYQVQQWKGIAADELWPDDWGWRESSGGLVPVQTDLPPAPKELLKMIRCNCQTDCSSLKCTCKKHEIECSAACGNCRGSACTNSTQDACDSDDDD